MKSVFKENKIMQLYYSISKTSCQLIALNATCLRFIEFSFLKLFRIRRILSDSPQNAFKLKSKFSDFNSSRLHFLKK